ncbi:uncharacterized protein METZ01_LOCUS379890, partial [marine metagenome]
MSIDEKWKSLRLLSSRKNSRLLGMIRRVVWKTSEKTNVT